MPIHPHIAQEDIVDRPPLGDHRNISPWLDEQIWGHRIYPQQTPWLIFLEFLTIAEASHRKGYLLSALNTHGEHYPINFQPYKRLYLRNILWNNEPIKRISDEVADSNTAWKEWLQWMETHAQGIDIRKFDYLKNRFSTFQHFALLIAMLKDAAVESDRNRRWTSRFVYPFGPNALYEDLNLSPSGGVTREYINFGRTGELLYLMLSRSSSADALRPYLSKILEEGNQWDVLLKLLQPESENDFDTRGKSYLPYKAHHTFNLLGEDWLHIFELNLPNFDAFQHLVTLGAFHLMYYQLFVAGQWTRREVPVSFICEVVAPKKTFIRELSTLNYQENNALPESAVEAYVNHIEQSDLWQQTLQNSPTVEDAFSNCLKILENEVWWGKKDDYNGSPDPSSLINDFREYAMHRHRGNTGEIHRIYGRGIGLISRRGTNKFRYAPTDAFLKTLIFANVSKRMELHDFLQLLFQRYGLVFGEREAAKVVTNNFDQKTFVANAARLEQRLVSLGFLRRLSDGCAYVINPYS
jgi:hypothetical protein